MFPNVGKTNQKFNFLNYYHWDAFLQVARIRRNEQTSRTPSISDEDDDHNQLLDRQEGTDREQDRGSEKEHKRNRDRDRRPEQKRWRGVLDDYDREKLEVSRESSSYKLYFFILTTLLLVLTIISPRDVKIKIIKAFFKKNPVDR